jgi:hypothetical protein
VNVDTLKFISTYAGALPVIAGLIVFKKAGFNYRVFIFFLLYGFITDLAVGYFYRAGMLFESRSAFYIYGLAEPLFLFWFVSRISENIPVIEAAYVIMLLIPFAWAFAYINFNIIEWKIVPSGGLFTTVYEMILSVLTAWSILQLTQKTESLNGSPAFWFLTGIFFVCLCTFLVLSFLEKKDIRDKFWWVENVANIISYFFYCYGFLKIETRKA